MNIPGETATQGTYSGQILSIEMNLPVTNINISLYQPSISAYHAVDNDYEYKCKLVSLELVLL